MPSKLNSVLNSAPFLGVKIFVLGVFVLLVAVDVYLFLPGNPYPTISQVVYDSSPKLLVFIWLYGLVVTNFFFQRETEREINFALNFSVLFVLTIVFMGFGVLIDTPEKDEINIQNYKSKISEYETPFITRVLCFKCCEEKTRVPVNCQELKAYKNAGTIEDEISCKPNFEFKLDLTLIAKLLILLTGIVAGLALWPRLPEQTKT